MNVLMVTHYFASHAGGIEAVAQRLFDGLAERGCHVTWAAAGVSAPPLPGPRRKALPLKTWNGVERALGVPFPAPSPAAFEALDAAAGDCEVVLLHDCLYLSNIAAFLSARRRGVPVVIVQHIGAVPYRNAALRLLMKLANALVTRPLLASAQQVVFISELTRRCFAGVRFARPPALVLNGVDTSVFRPLGEDEDRAAIRARLGLPCSGPVALFVGRFVEKKGLGVLREMAAREPHVTWAFAGAGPLDPASWKLDNVRVYSDLRGSGLAELYRAGDVLVLPSTGEGFPLVIQEALACGLPVVCGADTATADEALAPFVRGVGLTVGDERRSADEVLRAVREVLAEPANAEARRQRHEFAQARYSWTHAAARYEELLQLACRRPRAGAAGGGGGR
jgi:glycosyltransferase involved in cell wall biosynthesis